MRPGAGGADSSSSTGSAASCRAAAWGSASARCPGRAGPDPVVAAWPAARRAAGPAGRPPDPSWRPARGRPRRLGRGLGPDRLPRGRGARPARAGAGGRGPAPAAAARPAGRRPGRSRIFTRTPAARDPGPGPAGRGVPANGATPGGEARHCHPPPRAGREPRVCPGGGRVWHGPPRTACIREGAGGDDGQVPFRGWPAAGLRDRGRRRSPDDLRSRWRATARILPRNSGISPRVTPSWRWICAATARAAIPARAPGSMTSTSWPATCSPSPVRPGSARPCWSATAWAP